MHAMRRLAAVLATTGLALGVAAPADAANSSGKLKLARTCQEVRVPGYDLSHSATAIKVYRNLGRASSCKVVRSMIRRVLNARRANPAGQCAQGIISGEGCRVNVPGSGRWTCEPNGGKDEIVCTGPRSSTLVLFRLRDITG